MQDKRTLRGRIGRALALLDMVETARAEGMDAADIGLLVVLASHADEGGAAHPSQSTLAREVGRERPWVNRRLAALADTDLGGHKTIEKTRRRLAKGGETSCVYRIPLMDLAAVGAVFAPDSGDDTPCALRNHEQEKPHDLKSLSQGAGAPESAGEGFRDEADDSTLGAGWVPSADDIAFTAVKRPDLTPADLLLLGEKLIARHGGRLLLADASAVFRRWVLTERACRHAPDHDCRRPRPRSRQHEHQAAGPADGIYAARAANRDKALAALHLLAG